MDYGLNVNTVWLVRLPGGVIKHFYSDDIRVYDNPMNGKGDDVGIHLDTSGFGCVSLPDLAIYNKSMFCQKSSYPFTYFTFCKGIALHNVSYKGHAQLDNVAFITHYDMLWHIVMDISNRLYVL